MNVTQRFCLLMLSLTFAQGLSGCAGEAPDGGKQPARIAAKFDIGGHALFIDCRGVGVPTIVIDGGAGTWSRQYVHIQERLTGESRVCTYDRAGLGESDTGPAPRTSQQMVRELRILLERASETGPILYVGHSLGGYNARIYQRDYPHQVAGIVLVESGHERQWELLPPEVETLASGAVQAFRQLAKMADSGLIVREAVERQVSPVFSAPVRDQLIDAVMTAKPYLGSAAEFEVALASAEQVPKDHHLGDLPLVVLSAWNSFDVYEGTGIPVAAANETWLELQRKLVALSNNAVQLMSEGTHNLNETNPEDIVRAIRVGLQLVRRAN